MITFALGFACGGLVVFALWFFMALRGFVVPFKVGAWAPTEPEPAAPESLCDTSVPTAGIPGRPSDSATMR